MKTLLDPFAYLASRTIELLKEAQDAPTIADRIIAVSKLRAACNDYIGEVEPDKWTLFGQMMADVKKHAEQKKVAMSRPKEVGKLF